MSNTVNDMRNRVQRGSPIVVAVIVIAVIFFLLIFSGQFYYAFERVSEQEVGVQFQGGRIKNVVGPGVYSDVGLYVDLVRISSQAVPFSVEDSEIITLDKQRIGLVVTGDIFRPGVGSRDRIRELWAQYRIYYLDDQLVQTRVQELAKQAMKVCVGDRNFDDNVVGTARDVLRTCIDEELSSLADNFGLNIDNVVVPDVILSPEVQTALDAIVQSRLETEKAAQDKLRAEAQAGAEQARQEGEIRIEQSRFQEQARQQTLLAELEREKVAAQRAVIEAQKANDLLAAQRDLEIAEAQAVAAAEQAKATVAVESALAALYATNPSYVTLLMAQANANALNETDKVIFSPEGTTPTIVIPGPGIVPTIDAGQQTTSAQE
ncbi:MAG: SPFH domain-containing protein [Caldilineaceae bacterium]|nr:SPFH domain-containing protein [Caldilineaceae bacterium]